MNVRWMAVVGLAIANAGCSGCSPDDGFVCGYVTEKSTRDTPVCNGPREICVCATAACAKPSESQQCASGYIYLDKPFAPDSLAGKCVATEDVPWRVESGAKDPSCTSKSRVPSVDAGYPSDAQVSDGSVDSGVDATSEEGAAP